MLNTANHTEKELQQLMCELFCKIATGSGIKNFKGKYIGISGKLGDSIYYNSNHCAGQICMAMILSGHDLVYQLLTQKRDVDNFNPEPLYKAQILQGMKILDMGCGYIPTFARCARKLGAEVYTVDLKSADEFKSEKEHFTSEDRELEVKHHICGDLGNKSTINEIISLSGGNLDLVTEANLTSALFFGGKDIAMKILPPGGYWYDPFARGIVRKN
jgi:hypothetical protein